MSPYHEPQTSERDRPTTVAELYAALDGLRQRVDNLGGRIEHITSDLLGSHHKDVAGIATTPPDRTSVFGVIGEIEAHLQRIDKSVLRWESGWGEKQSR